MLFLAAGRVLALDPGLRVSQYQVQCFGVADGLPQGSVTAIALAPDGELLVATNRGLARFDGARARLLERDGKAVLVDDQINRMLVDGDGVLWVAAHRGLYRLDQTTLLHFGMDAGLPAERTISVSLDGDEVIAGTGRGAVRVARAPPHRLTPVPDWPWFISAVEVVADGYLIHTNDGLFRHRRGETPKPVATASGVATRGMFWNSLTLSDGRHLVAMRLGLAAVIEGVLRPFDGDGSLPPLPLRALLEDRDGQLWVATAGAGLYRQREGRFERLPGMDAEVVLSLAEDRDGTLWAGTVGGLCRVRDGAVLGYGLREGLATEFVMSVAVDPAGRVAVASNGRGLYRIEQDRVEHLGNPAGDPFVNYVATLADGTIVAASNGGTAQWRDGSFFPLHPALERVQINWLVSLPEGVWLQAGPVGVCWLQADTLDCPLPSEGKRWGLSARAGGAWLSGLGLWRLLPDGSVREIELRGRNDLLTCTAEDPRQPGTLWCHDAGAPARVRVDGGRAEVQHLSPTGAEIRGALLNLAIGRDQALWIATTGGLYRIGLADLDRAVEDPAHRPAMQRFDERHGLRSSEFTRSYAPGIAAVAHDGTMWWASMGGVVAIDPLRLVGPPRVPELRFEALRLEGVSLPRERWSRVPPEPGLLEIEYTAVDLSQAASLHFRHRLLPIQREFQSSDSRRLQAFALPPGQYRFEAQVTLDLGRWPVEPTGIDFVVEPHWYQTWTARIGALLLAALALVSLPLLRIRLLRRRERLLSQLVEQRTADLAEANAKLDRIARTDPLTGIANRRDLDEALQRLPDANGRAGAVALLLIDIDHFKRYNDLLGHPAGDQCLRQVALALAGAVPDRDALLARYGGEEFAVLLHGKVAPQAPELGHRLNAAVRELMIEHPGAPSGRVSISVGVAVSARGGEAVQSLLARADDALYRAKAEGRDRAVIA